jgi:hypothetical protein
MLPLNPIILLGRFHIASLMQNTFESIKCRHDKFWPIIKYDELSYFIVLIFNVFYEFFYVIFSFRFMSYASGSSVSRMIIYIAVKKLEFVGLNHIFLLN